jgi:acyl-CoA reductase-like NAD-dependent aldehyde dehydrogenase
LPPSVAEVDQRLETHKLFIDGEWIEGIGDQFTVTSPVNGEPLGIVPIATEEEVKAAIDAAETAKEKWRTISRYERAKLLLKAADELRKISGDAAKEITSEMGKPIIPARHELEFAWKLIVDAAEEIKRVETSYIPCEDPRLRAFTILEPYGVFAIITPWNFPYVVPLTTLAYALAAGNTVVFKPAEQSPLSGEKIVRCFERAGLPKGVLNLVQGYGETTGEALTSSNKLDGVGFTGSIAIGKRIAAKQGDKLTHFVFELGGNGPIVVLKDADLSWAAQAIAESCYGNAGQDCQAGERILVQEEIYEKLVQLIVEATEVWKPGDPFKEDTKFGPLVAESIAAKVDSHIADAVEKGARVRVGGKRAEGFPTKLYYHSTVLDGVSPEMLIAQEETFGPVAPMIRCESMDEIIEIANSGEYGLASSVFTRDIRSAASLSEIIKTGEVVINYPSTIVDINVPFGGMRKSGIGRANGKYGIMSFSQLKSVFWNVA